MREELDVHVRSWAVYVRAADNLATRTMIDRRGRVQEESYADRELVLWQETREESK